MAVFTKTVRTKTSQDKINQLIIGTGIDCVPLGKSEGLGAITVEFVCSDANPAQPRTIKDIDNLLMKLEDVKEVTDHRNEPTKSGKADHMLQISVDKDTEQQGTVQGDSKEIERG